MTCTPMSRLVQQEGLKVLEQCITPRKHVTLYGPDNKPIYSTPAGSVKVGDTIRVRKPQSLERRGPRWGTT